MLHLLRPVYGDGYSKIAIASGLTAFSCTCYAPCTGMVTQYSPSAAYPEAKLYLLRPVYGDGYSSLRWFGLSLMSLHLLRPVYGDGYFSS